MDAPFFFFLAGKIGVGSVECFWSDQLEQTANDDEDNTREGEERRKTPGLDVPKTKPRTTRLEKKCGGFPQPPSQLLRRSMPFRFVVLALVADGHEPLNTRPARRQWHLAGCILPHTLRASDMGGDYFQRTGVANKERGHRAQEMDGRIMAL